MTVLQEIEDLRQKLRYYSDKYYNDDAPEIEKKRIDKYSYAIQFK